MTGKREVDFLAKRGEERGVLDYGLAGAVKVQIPNGKLQGEFKHQADTIKVVAGLEAATHC